MPGNLTISSPPTAEQVHTWVTRHLPDRPHPSVKRPINWMRWISIVTVTLGVGTVVVSTSRYLLPIIQSRNIWASISLISILLFTSGHMFNHIRKVPYVAGDGKGGINYIAPGFQSQFGMETQIVAALCKAFVTPTQPKYTNSNTDGVLSFCAITLAFKVPRMADAKTQQVAVIAWGGVLFLVYSFLLSVFRIKNGGYPFSLPPFM
jgi:oligosaccharyltransferase complex subunit gamma